MVPEMTQLLDEVKAELRGLIKHPRLAASPEVGDGMIGTLVSVVLALERGVPYTQASSLVGTEYQRLLRELHPDGAYRVLCQTDPWDFATPWPRAHGDSEEDVWKAFRLLSERYRELCSRLGVVLSEPT